MTLLGDRNWWAPAPLRRLHRRFGMSEQVSPSVPQPRSQPSDRLRMPH
jgi:RND superfamily putative drug exporter